MNDTIEFQLEGYIGQADLFARDKPASLEGPGERWEFAKEVIDHGCFILLYVNDLRDGKRVRDSVTGALLRRSLIIAEGIRVSLSSGLEESASILFRSLLELELNLRLVTADETEGMAQRLAGFHYLSARRHFDKIFRHPDSRGRLQDDPSHWDWSRNISRTMKEFFESGSFDDVRTELARSQYWHGYVNLEDAFSAAGMNNDYLRLYDVFSPFSHVTNLEFDFADIENGRPLLKALPQRDPVRALNILEGMLLKLLSIFSVFLEDRGNPEYQPPLPASSEQGEQILLSPLTALQARLVSAFRIGPDQL